MIFVETTKKLVLCVEPSHVQAAEKILSHYDVPSSRSDQLNITKDTFAALVHVAHKIESIEAAAVFGSVADPSMSPSTDSDIDIVVKLNEYSESEAARTGFEFTERASRKIQKDIDITTVWEARNFKTSLNNKIPSETPIETIKRQSILIKGDRATLFETPV